MTKGSRTRDITTRSGLLLHIRSAMPEGAVTLADFSRTSLRRSFVSVFCGGRAGSEPWAQRSQDACTHRLDGCESIFLFAVAIPVPLPVKWRWQGAWLCITVGVAALRRCGRV